MRFRLTFAGLVVAVSGAGDPLPPHILNLARIERQMREQLSRLPNYTCLETIDRYVAPPRGRKKPVDRIRISIALVGGKELYAWPGAAFGEQRLSEMLNGGFTSEGDFASMARSVFVNRVAEVTYVGEEAAGSRRLLHYKFHIAQNRSAWSVKSGRVVGDVGAGGSFWADAESFDLVRMAYAAEELPPFSDYKRLEESAEFGRVRIGSDETLLPLSADLLSESFDGTIYQNHDEYSGCRQYSSESSISFGDDPTPALATAVAVIAESAPADLSIPLRLETPIDSRTAALGDELRATVTKDVRFRGHLVLPRGAVATGVLCRIERHSDGVPYFEVGIEFTQAEYQGHRVSIYGRLAATPPFAAFRRANPKEALPEPPNQAPGVGYFSLEGKSVQIAKGSSLTWLTLPGMLR